MRSVFQDVRSPDTFRRGAFFFFAGNPSGVPVCYPARAMRPLLLALIVVLLLVLVIVPGLAMASGHCAAMADRALAMDPDNFHALWSKAQTHRR